MSFFFLLSSKGSRNNSETNTTQSETDVVESEMNSNLSDVYQGTENEANNSTNNDEQSLVIMLDQLKTDDNEKNVDNDKEEMERAIVNINRKTRPLIKHVNVGNKDVLHIAIDDKDLKPKAKVKGAILDEQVSNWEDLCNDDDELNRGKTAKVN